MEMARWPDATSCFSTMFHRVSSGVVWPIFRDNTYIYLFEALLNPSHPKTSLEGVIWDDFRGFGVPPQEVFGCLRQKPCHGHVDLLLNLITSIKSYKT